MTVANQYVPSAASMPMKRTWETYEPRSHDVGSFERYETVTFGPRLGARALDAIFLLALAVVWTVVSISALVWLSSDGRQVTGWGTLPARALGILNALSFYGISEAFAGASLGKLLCGMRVVQFDGRPCSLTKAYIRQALFFVDAVFFGLVAYSVMSGSGWNQRIGDRVAGTVVVYKHALESRRLVSATSTGQVLLGVAAATAACSAMTFVGIWLLTL